MFMAPRLYKIKAKDEDGNDVFLHLQIDHDQFLDSIGERERPG